MSRGTGLRSGVVRTRSGRGAVGSPGRAVMGRRIDALLVAMYTAPHREMAPLDIGRRATGVPSGAVVSTLARMETLGWVSSRWDTRARQGTFARPRLYKLTDAGVRRAAGLRR